MNMSKGLIAMVNSLSHDLNQHFLMFWQLRKVNWWCYVLEKRRKSRRPMHLHIWKEKEKSLGVVENAVCFRSSVFVQGAVKKKCIAVEVTAKVMQN